MKKLNRNPHFTHCYFSLSSAYARARMQHRGVFHKNIPKLGSIIRVTLSLQYFRFPDDDPQVVIVLQEKASSSRSPTSPKNAFFECSSIPNLECAFHTSIYRSMNALIKIRYHSNFGHIKEHQEFLPEYQSLQSTEFILSHTCISRHTGKLVFFSKNFCLSFCYTRVIL